MTLNKIAENKFLKYVFFAVLTSLVNIFVYLGIYDLVIKSIVISNVVAYTASITLQFVTNRNLVFKSSGNVLIQMILFLITKVIAFFIDTLVLILCFNYLHLSNFISKLISNCSTTLSNYILNDKLVFKIR